MRDIVVTVVIFALVPFCFARPWVGILVWSWIGYMNPHRLAWGFAYHMPFAAMVGLATLAGLFFTSERRAIRWTREMWLLVGLWAIFVLSTIFALYPEEAWPQLQKVSKVLIMVFVTVMLFQDRGRLRYLLITVALSLGFYGFKGGIFGLVTGGAYQVVTPDETSFGGNTGAGLALNMVLPFLFFLGREEEKGWLRLLLRVTFALSTVAVVFTYSRGALIGLAVTLTFLLVRSRTHIAGALGLLALGGALVMMAPPEWFHRMETITDYSADESAMQRLTAWYVGWRLALDHPLLGGGFWVFPHPEVFGRYVPDFSSDHNAHSIYFNVLGEHGFLGMFFFGGLIVSSLLTLQRLRTSARRAGGPSWIANYAAMLQVSMIAYMVTGAFLSAAYFDLFYHLIGMVVVLKVVAEPELDAARRHAPTPAPQPAVSPTRAPLVRWSPGG